MPQSAGSDTIRCFGQRMLSPYHGVMHCVVTDWADAATLLEARLRRSQGADPGRARTTGTGTAALSPYCIEIADD